MNKRSVGYAIGKLLQVMAFIMFIPFFIGLYNDVPQFKISIFLGPEFLGFSLSILISWFVGFLLIAVCYRYRQEIGVREGYAVVTFGWITLSAVGCLPLFFYFVFSKDMVAISDVVHFFSDAYFETMSGFTTTGSTILTDIETIPKGILFWRSMTHWLGGMGIITLALAIFPAMGVSGYGMYKGEVPGPTKERLQPRLSETAKILWGVYLLFTVLETSLLFFGGMSLFDSFCHTFGTLATGGFSTKNLSVGYYQNTYFHWVIIIFMVLSGINYIIHYRVLLKRHYRSLFEDKELHFYLATLLIGTLFVTGILYFQGLPDTEIGYESYRYDKMSFNDFEKHMSEEEAKIDTLSGAFSQAAFQVVSILTTTGFCTADFDVWPDVCRLVLIILMFWGGCAGSTGGGLKIIRVITVMKISWREIKKLAKPRWISPIKIGQTSIDERRVINILSLFNLFLLTFVICSTLMCLFIPDLLTAISCVVATLFNIGPGLSGVGAVENYAWIPLPGKWILIMCMLMGRLEIFSVLIALRPAIWKK
ncbi:TrkH family potassium uptake protein [bacterium]|nr:TrkH family potassium uptake protein [candidate division CSSED10-310 bacterium]